MAIRNIIFIAVILCTLSCKDVTNTESTVYYLIRHAEKNRSVNHEDPELTNKGLERANNWATIFKDVKFDYIYSTTYKRTMQTSTPTANSKKIEILNYDANQLNDKDFQEKTKGKTVLVVGHSNTTPAFVNAIIGENKYQDINDKDNGKLFIVTLNPKATVKIEDYP